MAERSDEAREQAFPWHLGIYDAHCHPTDTMSSIDSIRRMKARVLTIFSTRAQDQDLVARVTDELGFTDAGAASGASQMQQVIPGFGWHPWFSHQLFDDTREKEAEAPGAMSLEDRLAWKQSHYQSLLVPMPEDREFLESLPYPRLLSQQVSRTRALLEKYPLALVGEIGLDRSFRLPTAWTSAEDCARDPTLTPGGREGRKLTPYRVSVDHQKKVLQRQLNLAGEMQRAVSVHGVQAHGALFAAIQETWKEYEQTVPSKRLRKLRSSVAGAHASEVKEEVDQTGNEIGGDNVPAQSARPFPPRICLHSYSGPREGLRQYLDPAVPAAVFFSFSSVINLSKTPAERVREVLRSVPDDRVLVESDFHCAGERMDRHLEEITRFVCQTKGWTLEEGIPRLASNWQRFAFGDASSETTC